MLIVSCFTYIKNFSITNSVGVKIDPRMPSWKSNIKIAISQALLENFEFPCSEIPYISQTDRFFIFSSKLKLYESKIACYISKF